MKVNSEDPLSYDVPHNIGHKEFYLPSDLPSDDDYFVRICDYSNPGEYDDSDGLFMVIRR
jgi:hypothetical protein